jgi:hypothetical protein
VPNRYIERAVSFFAETSLANLLAGALGCQLQQKSLELPLSVAIFGSKLVESSMLLHWVHRWCRFWSVSLRSWCQTLTSSHEKANKLLKQTANARRFWFG